MSSPGSHSEHTRVRHCQGNPSHPSVSLSVPCSPDQLRQLSAFLSHLWDRISRDFCSPAHGDNRNKSSSSPSFSATAWKALIPCSCTTPTNSWMPKKKSPSSLPTHRHQTPPLSLVPSTHNAIFTFLPLLPNKSFLRGCRLISTVQKRAVGDSEICRTTFGFSPLVQQRAGFCAWAAESFTAVPRET